LCGIVRYKSYGDPSAGPGGPGDAKKGTVSTLNLLEHLFENFILNRFPAEKIPSRPKILLIKLRSIGDVIYNTAVYTPIKKKWPDAHLTVVVETPSLDMVKHHPDVDEVLCFRKGSVLEQAEFYYRLFQNRYDIAIDMHRGPRGAIMCFLSQARFRVGTRYSKRSFFYNVKLSIKDLRPKLPIDYQAALVRKMGVEIDNLAPRIIIAESSRQNAHRLLEEQGIKEGEDYCIIHPGTPRPYDRWQVEKFARLVEILSSEYGLKVVLTCGPGQDSQVHEITDTLENTPYVFIKTNLQELGAMTENARLVICHDGGYMHLASVLGAPVIALYGLTNKNIWKPYGDKSSVISKEVECRPCNAQTMKQVCRDGVPECKEMITVDDVIDEVKKILEPGYAR
jgi:lipopolysaccharide heptosyltransferase II